LRLLAVLAARNFPALQQWLEKSPFEQLALGLFSRLATTAFQRFRWLGEEAWPEFI